MYSAGSQSVSSTWRDTMMTIPLHSQPPIGRTGTGGRDEDLPRCMRGQFQGPKRTFPWFRSRHASAMSLHIINIRKQEKYDLRMRAQGTRRKWSLGTNRRKCRMCKRTTLWKRRGRFSPSAPYMRCRQVSGGHCSAEGSGCIARPGQG